MHFLVRKLTHRLALVALMLFVAYNMLVLWSWDKYHALGGSQWGSEADPGRYTETYMRSNQHQRISIGGNILKYRPLTASRGATRLAILPNAGGPRKAIHIISASHNIQDNSDTIKQEGVQDSKDDTKGIQAGHGGSVGNSLLSSYGSAAGHGLWPENSHNYNDRIVDQIEYKSHNITLDILRTKPKVILVYSGLGSTPHGQDQFVNDACGVSSCILTDDVELAPSADAIMFQTRVFVTSYDRPSHQVSRRSPNGLALIIRRNICN